MQQGVRLVDLINPLLKILKDREELYFQLLTFVNKNIDSSSIDLDHTTIINRFLPPLRAAHQTLLSREKQLLGSLSEVSEEGKVAKGASKEMIRFSSRVMQLLEASINRVRKGIFDQNGRSDREYVRFKVNLHRILKKQPFDLSQFAESLVNYVTGKFQRQLGKVQKYLQKTWEGQDILLRQLYMKGSDLEGSSSPQQKTEKKQKKEPPTLKKQQLKLNIESHANQQDEKKVRRPLKSSLKRKQKPTVRKKVKQSPRPQQSDQQQPRKVLNKQQTANKLLKFYGLLQLSRKEFLQDYMFQNIEQQKHKNELMNKLLERNKVINSQINTYIRKSATHIAVPLIIMPPPSKSSGDQKNQKNESQIAKLTGRASFVITRRRGSFHAQTSVLEPHSDHPPEFYYEDNAIKNLLPTRKKSSHSHQKPHQKSRKLYIVKQPMVFEDQVIPQAQVTKTQWLQAPLSLKKDKRNQNVRLKRKHNPTPLQNADLSQNFRYPS